MKKNVALYIIIVILVAVIAVGGTYIFMKGQLDKPGDDSKTQESTDVTSKDEPKKSGVELVSTKEEEQNIVQTFNVYMNGKTVDFKIKYEKGADGEPNSILGTNGSLKLYYNVTGKNTFSIDNINKNFNINNFKIITGIDNKEYLLIATNMENAEVGYSDILYVYNDNLELLSGDFNSSSCLDEKGFTIYSRGSGVQVKEDPWYKNTFSNNLEKNSDGWSSVRVKIENDQIYYLYPILNNEDSSTGTLEERVYTINNGKLTYKTINTYKIINASGGAC